MRKPGTLELNTRRRHFISESTQSWPTTNDHLQVTQISLAAVRAHSRHHRETSSSISIADTPPNEAIGATRGLGSRRFESYETNWHASDAAATPKSNFVIANEKSTIHEESLLYLRTNTTTLLPCDPHRSKNFGKTRLLLRPKEAYESNKSTNKRKKQVNQ